MQREEKKPVIGKRYMSGSLEQMIMTYPAKPSGKEELEKGTWIAHLQCQTANAVASCALFYAYVGQE